jgi:2',3'-cyclic-nucleotide 2'-phosphodiesterase (5'-nucleotidase family)
MRNQFLLPAILVASGIFSGCAGKQVLQTSENLVPQHAFQSTDPTQVTIAVVGINDFHGSLQPRERKLATASGELLVKSGGASVLYSMISILKKEMNNRVLIVDAGDEWQGTLESNLNKGHTVVDFFNRLGVKVAAVGNHEFDFNIHNMQMRFNEAKYPYVAANIFVKKTGRRPGWKNFYPSRIFNVDGIKFGVIGHSTVNTPGTTRFEYVKDLEFRGPFPIVDEESATLRKQGASAVLMTTHSGTFCERKNLNQWRLLSSAVDQGKCEADELTALTSNVKTGVLDGIVSGHTHQIIHHWLNGIPVVQDEAYNQHFNVIYYTFDRKTRRLIPELTRIEGLIPICEKTFEGSDHCDVRRLGSSEVPHLREAVFHGQKVIPDSSIEAWMKPIVAGTEKYRKEVVVTAGMPLQHHRDQEGAFGNLVADALLDKSGADFSLVNSGGIRISLDAGPITFDGLFRALPFDNILNVIRLKGKDVKLLYRIATAGSHGIVAFSGLQIKLIPFDREVPKEDLNGDGKFEPWESNRIVEIRTSEGKELKDDQYYTIATFDYLVNGGDDLSWFMKRISSKNVSRKFSDYSRDLVTAYLRKKKVINTVEEPLVDPSKPRVLFQN